MDCSSRISEPAARLTVWGRWLASSVMAFAVSLAAHPHGAAATLLLLLFILAGAAGATTFVVGDDEDLLDASDVAILGAVESVQTVAAEDRVDRLAKVRVGETFKGNPPPEITVRLSGGRIDGRRHVVFGAADLGEGERVVLFLRERGDGIFTTAQMALGKFTVVGEGRQALAVRDLRDAAVMRARAGRLVRRQPWDIRRLAELEASLRSPGANPTNSPEPMLPPGFRPRFSMLSAPATRWYEADEGLAILYQVEPGNVAAAGVDASWALDQATTAWSRVDCSTARLTTGDEAVIAPFYACDGRTQVLFGDPLNELDPPVRCSGAVGVGGFCSVPGDRVVGGVVYDRITEADVVINNGFDDCLRWNEVNLSEILTHELGHTLGLGHSSNDPNEPDPRLADATMYFRAHMDGRGAVVMDDDRDGICAVYPQTAIRDADGDGVPDGIDDCPAAVDPDQSDRDGDGLGDSCDPLTLGPAMLRPEGDAAKGSRLKITAILRPDTPFDLEHETLTVSFLGGSSALVHQIVLRPDAWRWNERRTAFSAMWLRGTLRESVKIHIQPDGSYKLRLRGRSIEMDGAGGPVRTVRIEAGSYAAAGELHDADALPERWRGKARQRAPHPIG